jgi:hypothetical protein
MALGSGGRVSETTVKLADAIEALRVGLTEAITRGHGQPMHFSLDPVELTIQAVVTKDAEGRIGWSVLGVGAGYEAGHTQTVKLRLTPLWTAKDGTLTHDFAIASASDEDDTIGPHD